MEGGELAHIYGGLYPQVEQATYTIISLQSNLLDCYAGNNPVRYTDPDGRISLFSVIPDSEKISKQDARDWIQNNVCTNIFNYTVCSEMYTQAMLGGSTTYKRGSGSHIATLMASDEKAYVNKVIPQRLKQGIKSGGYDEKGPGQTSWSNKDLKLSIGSCSFTWELDNYDQKSKVATVSVHITDTFDFNEGNGKRKKYAEKLTALGRKAELAEYKVSVTYKKRFKVKMPEE